MQALHIAVGVLIDAQGRVLIAERRAGTAGAGKWEFPGGKREVGETIEQALARELDEELGIQTGKIRPMLRFQHDYTARRVLLDIWQVLDWTGEAHGREGQTLVWCEPGQLLSYDLLSANKPIVDAIRLPAIYVITADPGSKHSDFLRTAKAAVEAGERLIRLRAWSLSNEDYEALANDLVEILDGNGASLMLDRTADIVKRVGAAGLHLPASALSDCTLRPVPETVWFAVSCHNREELLQAKAIGADFAVLSPVATTSSHPDQPALGWTGFALMRDDIALPVYALGGLGATDVETAWRNGGQGVAGIGAFWPPENVK